MFSHADDQSRLRARRRRRPAHVDARDRARDEERDRPSTSASTRGGWPRGAEVQVAAPGSVDRLKNRRAHELYEAGPPARRSSDCWNCRRAAEVKNSEPTKYVTPSAVAPTQLEYGGNDPSAKQVDPTMNSAATHHARRPRPLASQVAEAARLLCGHRHRVGCLSKWAMAFAHVASRIEARSRVTPWRTRMRCTGMSDASPVSVYAGTCQPVSAAGRRGRTACSRGPRPP